MRKSNIFEKIFYWFKSLFADKEKAKENSDEAKREMCGRSIRSGVCPHDCDRCAWNTLR